MMAQALGYEVNPGRNVRVLIRHGGMLGGCIGLQAAIAFALDRSEGDLVRADLHMHTNWSDGYWSVANLETEVQRRGLKAWSITDHDTTAAYDHVHYTDGLIMGIELTAWGVDREVHVVGLGFDRYHSAIHKIIERIGMVREQRAQVLLEHVARRSGTKVLPLESCRFNHAVVITRSHIAQALVANGIAAHSGEVYNTYLGDHNLRGLPRPAFPEVAEVAAVIQQAGGVAILAHPGCYKNIQIIEQLLDSGVDGVEIKHPNFSPSLAGMVKQAAQKRGLLLSCGSDSHGPTHRKRLGDCRLSRSELMPLLKRVAWEDPLAAISGS